jgi:hypothetical protein
MLHRTLAMMIEKGVPIPPELLKSAEPQRSNLQGGLWHSPKIGPMLFFWMLGGGVILNAFVLPMLTGEHCEKVFIFWALGFVPLCIGTALLIAWKLEQRKPKG